MFRRHSPLPTRPATLAAPAQYPSLPNTHVIPVLASKDPKVHGKYVYILKRAGTQLLVQAPPQEGAPDGMGPMWVTVHHDAPNAFDGC